MMLHPKKNTQLPERGLDLFLILSVVPSQWFFGSATGSSGAPSEIQLWGGTLKYEGVLPQSSAQKNRFFWSVALEFIERTTYLPGSNGHNESGSTPEELVLWCTNLGLHTN